MWRRSLAAALPVIASLASAQDHYPSRPIKLVVPYPPGALTAVADRSSAPSSRAGRR
jgi:tripartite-type tricarboxylate transporter receptor subunit TctC